MRYDLLQTIVYVIYCLYAPTQKAEQPKLVNALLASLLSDVTVIHGPVLTRGIPCQLG